MSTKKTKWQSYEEVSTYLLNQIAHKFGLSHFEGKQKIGGKRSGTEWEIDAKGVKGQAKFSTEHKGVSYRFSSDSNLNKFKKEPLKFLPQYGGWCAYAMASKGEKVKVNPKTFEIRNGKLYLFYDAYFDNTFENWIEEGPDELVLKADENWKKFQ